ncbi:MAG: hypothetical protein K2H35_03765 [Muribaculaceae bacterium]|nr:hypothetical protein [Muribaculaceae bacterium]
MSTATISNVAELTGGINAGNFIDTDIDEQLFRFNSDDTPLMNLMLRAKRVKVNSPEVDHYMIDEPASYIRVASRVSPTTASQTTIPVSAKDQNLVRPFTTLLAHGINGFDDEGKNPTPGKWLMLFVIGHDSTTNNPIVRAINGPRDNPSDEFPGIPQIPAGTVLTILANSLYETQKEVDPDIIVPQPTRVFLQKRGMNQVVSDYFESQRKRLPFSKAVIAEQAIANFKVRGNRTLWAGRAGKMKINVPKMGMQYVYTTEGLRWQFKREMQHSGKWTIEKLIAMAKMFFTGEDVPKTALLLAGKNLLEQIQCIDFSKHPEIQISTRQNELGWSVTRFHTVFGDIEIKREPTLDRLGWSNSGALIGEDRIVHYVYSSEHSFSDRVDGEEATRNGILIWDAIALKGSCHIWIDGDGNTATTNPFRIWDSPEAPENPVDGMDYYLICDCPGIKPEARAGQKWRAEVTLDNSVTPPAAKVTWRQLQ